MVALVAALAGLAAALALSAPARSTVRSDRVRRPPAVVALVAVAAVSLGLLRGHQLAVALIAVLAVLGGQRLRARRRAAGAAERRADRVREFCEAVAADLEAGQPSHACLDRVAREMAEFAGVATAARLGADVPTALRRLAAEPGSGDLGLVAAAWQVAHRSGSGLAAALERVAITLRERRRTSRLVAAELASAHATARMMAVLPVLFVLGGSGLGGDPVGFLTSTTPGLVCLGSGLALTYTGLAWLQRISDRVLT